MIKGRLGILVTEKCRTPPFSEHNYYEYLSEFGHKCGISVIVFTPDWIDWTSEKITGFIYNPQSKRWNKERFPFPDLIYDRCFFGSSASYLTYCAQIYKLRRCKSITFLGYGLNGKWYVNELLLKDSKIAPFLPYTEKVSGADTIKHWLTEYGELLLKPQTGSQGRMVMYVRRLSSSPYPYLVKGRNAANHLFQYSFSEYRQFISWLNRFMGSRRFIVQRYLQLSTQSDEPFDIRSFVQKNHLGQWQLIGYALRKGKPHSLTSNLHGGGVAEQVVPFLEQHYGDKTAELVQRIQTLSLRIAHTLEKSHGRLMELGIDLGIDREGRLWLLEVNSRPGRTIFKQIGDPSARRAALRNPIYYACYLWNRQKSNTFISESASLG